MAHRKLARLAALVAAQVARRRQASRISNARGRAIVKLYQAACAAQGLSSVEAQQIRGLERDELVEVGSDGRVYLTPAGWSRLL